MKIIIAPAKKMTSVDEDWPMTTPLFIEQTKVILQTLKSLTYDELQRMWRTSDQLTQINADQLRELDLNRALTPAIFSYHGIQYQNIAPNVMTQDELDYLQAHLRIISGFYGVLRPFDGIVNHRLELGSKLAIGATNNLYAFWHDLIYQGLQLAPGEMVVNLASKEYAKAISQYVDPDNLITIKFVHEINGQFKTSATKAKMARGAMVRYLAVNQITDVQAIQQFSDHNYQFDAALSTATELVFVNK